MLVHDCLAKTGVYPLRSVRDRLKGNPFEEEVGSGMGLKDS